MFINEIPGKKLKKPLEVKISTQYIAENEELELFGQGDTEEEAVEDLKEVFLDMYENFLKDEPYTDSGDEYRKRFLSYFD